MLTKILTAVFIIAFACNSAKAGTVESAVLEGMMAQGSGYMKKGDLEEARRSYQNASDYAREKFGPGSSEFGMATAFLGLTFVELGADDIAEVLLIKAQVILDKFPKLNATQMTVSSALAEIYRKQGKVKDAEDALKHSIETSEKNLGPNHIDVATGLGMLTVELDKDGKHEEAIPLIERQLRIEMARLEPGDSETLGTIEFLAAQYIITADYAHAEEILGKAILSMDSVIRQEDMRVGRLEGFLGLVYYRDGKIADALHSYERALKIAKHALDPGDSTLAIHYVKVAHCLADLGRYPDADTAYAIAIDILSRAISVPGDFDLKEIMQDYAKVLRKLGKVQEAEAMEERANSSLSKSAKSK
jgi:tetratricopeptide (TPR) repeat protein